MDNKKNLRRNIKKIQRVKTWQLFILLILMGFLSATFLRLNNIGMIQRRTAVMDADVLGDKAVIQNRLYDLQRYVSSHMNADMGAGIALESSYKRDAQKAYESVTSDSDVYRKAQEVCMPQYSSWSQAYVLCTANELDKYEGIDSVSWPDPKAYTHVFVSPLWSPDFAGWSVLICIAIFTMIVVRFIGVIILKILLRRYKEDI